MYKVYKFCCDNSIMVLPISWVKKNKVPFAPNAGYFIKNKKVPPKRWPLYDVKPVDGKLYESYDAALKAEEILIEKTDVNSEDYEKCLETNNQTQENKRKRKLGIDIAVSSSENDTEDDEKENLPIAPVKRFLSCHNAADMENAFNLMTNEHNNNKRINNELSELPSQDENPTEPQPNIEMVTNFQEEIVTEEILNQEEQNPSLLSFSLVDPTVMEETMRKIVREELEKFKTQLITNIQGLIYNPNRTAKYTEFQKKHNFPLKTIEQLEDFEAKIRNDEITQNEFRSYILQIGGKSPKENIKIISCMYHLELQQLISYTGREKKKFAIKDLKHIEILIDTIVAFYGTTQRETVLLLQRYLQQTFDRVRTAAKKLKSDIPDKSSN